MFAHAMSRTIPTADIISVETASSVSRNCGIPLLTA